VQRVKLFKGVETDRQGLEREINDWIEESGARVIQVSGNIAPQTVATPSKATSTRAFDTSDLFVVILYES
jgi:hypothetical protein